MIYKQSIIPPPPPKKNQSSHLIPSVIKQRNIYNRYCEHTHTHPITHPLSHTHTHIDTVNTHTAHANTTFEHFIITFYLLELMNNKL